MPKEYSLSELTDILADEVAIGNAVGDQILLRLTGSSELEILKVDEDGNESASTVKLTDLELVASSGGGIVALKAPDAFGGSFILTLPSADGSNGDVLTTDGAGNITFETPTTPPSALDDLTDVDAGSPGDLDILRYNNGTGNWENQSLPPIPDELDDLSDVDIGSATDQDFLRLNGSLWEGDTIDLADLTDVDPSGALAGDVLQLSGGTWQPNALAISDLSDVDTAGSSNGDILKLQSGTWQDGSLDLDEIANVDVPAPADNQVLTFNNGTSNWEAQNPSGGSNARSIFSAVDVAGNFAIGTVGYTAIPLDTQIRVDPAFSHTVDTPEVTINEDGWYEITYSLALGITSGNSRSDALTRLAENTGSGFVQVPGSVSATYNRNSTQNKEGASATVIRQYSAGDIIRLEALRDSSTNTISTLPDSVSLVIRNADASGEKGDPGGANMEVFYAYNSTGNQSLNGTFQDIPLNVTVEEDAPYSHTPGSDEVTFNEDGRYEITFDFSVANTAGSVGSALARLAENTGSGFTAITQSLTYALAVFGQPATASATITRDFDSGDIIKIEAQETSGTVVTVPNAIRLSIKKLND